MVSAQGQVTAWYDKIQLVPFGEYVPFRAVLGYFVNRIVHGMGDMIPGPQQTLFDVNGAKLSVLICYESIFPDLARRSVKEGADVMVNITNDAWYGTSSAPYQLLAMAAMRSVETKIPMIRVANTGISAIILDDGSITATTPLFKRGTETRRRRVASDAHALHHRRRSLRANMPAAHGDRAHLGMALAAQAEAAGGARRGDPLLAQRQAGSH